MTTRGPGIIEAEAKTIDKFDPSSFVPVTLADSGLVRLDIACGPNKAEGFTGIDILPIKGVDIVHNLYNFPWPIKDNTVAEAQCSHFLEHLTHVETPEVDLESGLTKAPKRWIESIKKWGHVRDLWFDFFEELHRIMAPGGIVTFLCPYFTSSRFVQDCTHVRPIGEDCFKYTSQSWYESVHVCYPYEADFDIVRQQPIVNPEFVSRSPEALAWMTAHEWNICDDVRIVLRAKKPARCWWKELEKQLKKQE